MSAEGSMEDEPLSIRDSPTLPEEAEHSGNAVNDESNKDNNSPPREHHLMTTRELQLYWQKEKYDGKPVRLLFQIHSTRIAEDFLSKFVLYKIVIIKTGSFDGKKVFIERRYSDFERLHRNLLKDFKDEMEDVVFPKKILMGNLTEEIIRMRMIALKDYLGELYAIKYVRKSCQFVTFFIESELGEGYSCIRGGQYKKATETLEQVLYLQEKLVDHCPIMMVTTLCALVVCHKDMDQLEKAYETGMKALELLQKHPRHRYYNPLLDTLISLAYKLGKDFLSLREKFENGENKATRSSFEGEMITLKELVVKERLPTD
ncbi:sorting nexin-20 [Rana temporaria]|uniref:sorting nexin-20 n=1 Tax=Rana temporaria TaxID=8407 RepID=UPI001AACC8DA|nr:sorting nexin-20 [Rana temporaria]XP_040184639.1 sorting nexin-20 [Rana temporaria]